MGPTRGSQVTPPLGTPDEIPFIKPVYWNGLSKVIPADGSACAEGTVYDPAELSCKKCDVGTFAPLRGSRECDVCPKGTACNRIGCSACQVCGEFAYNPLEGQGQCVPCPAGTVSITLESSSLLDCVCQVGYYRYDGMPGLECLPCPDNADCPGKGSLPIPLDGHWADTANAPSKVFRCNPSLRCVRGSETGCATGFEGFLCNQCQHGYFKLGGTDCKKCPSTSAMRHMMVIFGTLLVVSVWVVLNSITSGLYNALDIGLLYAQMSQVRLHMRGKLYSRYIHLTLVCVPGDLGVLAQLALHARLVHIALLLCRF